MGELPSGTITFLLTDIEGSTRRWASHPESMRRALARHDEIISGQVSDHGGRLVELGREGDSILAVFTRAGDAVVCAARLQIALQAEAWPEGAELKVRMAMHSGEAELRGGHYYGQAVYRCARLLAVGHGGQVLLSQATQDLVIDALPPGASLRDLGLHRLADLDRPERVFQLLHRDLEDEFRPLRSLTSRRHNLPLQLTSFVGRSRELAEIKSLLSDSRLLTLTGVAGTGKTRLALEAAAELLDDYPDGVWLVELTPLREDSLVAQTVADALGLHEVEGRIATRTLAASIGGQRMLLLLDSCEHLVAAIADLTQGLLEHCPNLRILATSREVLKVMGEVTWPVPPMTLTTLDHVLGEAVTLFLDRARSIRPGFSVDDDGLPPVVQICERLDGLPLAIELAAARVKVMSPVEILRHLDDRFRLLASEGRMRNPRHRTLRAAVDWSYQLLTEPERILFARLSVFVGGFDLEAAEAVSAGGAVPATTVLDLISQLVDRSLVVVRPGREGRTRYALLETLRDYGRERVREGGEGEAVRVRHAAHFLALAEAAAPHIWDASGPSWLRRLDEDHDNLRAALRGGAPELELRLAAALVSFWYARGHYREGRAHLAAALAKSSRTGLTRAAALRGHAKMAWSQGDLTTAEADSEESLALCRGLGDPTGIVLSLELLARISVQRDHFLRAGSLLDEALSLAHQLEDPRLIGLCLFRKGMMAMNQSDLPTAEESLQASLALGQESGDHELLFLALGVLGHLAARRGRYDQARLHLSQVLAGWREQVSRRQIPYLLESCALVAAGVDQPERALRLLGAAAALRRLFEVEPSPVFQREVQEKLGPARNSAGGAAAWKEGENMSLEEAIDYALTEEPGVKT